MIGLGYKLMYHVHYTIIDFNEANPKVIFNKAKIEI